MKATKIKLAVGLAAYASLLAGSALAQDTSNVVGYEKLDVIVGFNYFGQRLVGSADISTTVVGVAGTTLTLAADSGLAGVNSVFEVNSGVADGTVTTAVVTGASAVTADDLSAEVVNGDSVAVRELATLESVFGDADAAALILTASASTAGADIILIPDGLGGFDRYHVSPANPFTMLPAAWNKIDDGAGGGVVDPATVEIVYTDMIAIQARAATCVTITGDVKTANTSYALAPEFNYLSSIYPAGATLESAFGDATAAALILTASASTAGADIILNPDGAGGFDRYHVSPANPFTMLPAAWNKIDDGAGGGVIDPTTVSLASGTVIQNRGGAQNLLITPPDFYSTL